MEGKSEPAFLAVTDGAREPAKRRREEAADEATETAKRQKEAGMTTGREAEETAKRRRQDAAEAGVKRWREIEEGSRGGHGLIEERRTRPTRVQPALPPSQQRAPLQRLVDACRTVFHSSETVPQPAAVSLIRGLLDEMGPEDVGLRAEVRFFNKMNTAGRQNPLIITCKNLYECDNFTIAVFFLPQGTVMPLHDHPGMTVFSKLLVGSAHVNSYDWIDPSAVSVGSNPDDRSMLAKKVLDRDLTAASSTWVLYPNAGGNMHRFAAGEDCPCAFIDVLTPPYSPAQRQGCNFYQDFPYELHPNVIGVNLTEEQKRQLAWLRQIDTPKDFRIFNLPYRGPAIL